jgi:Flp pilus assembly protein TadB
MNRLLIVFVLVVIAVVGVTYYLGWWNVKTDSTDHKAQIGVTVDRDKIQEDEKKAVEKMHDLGRSAKDKAAGPSEKAKEQPAPVQSPQD